MTTAVATLDINDPEQVDRGITFLTRCLRSQRSDQAAREASERVVSALTAPADPVMTMARVGALLEPYFDKGTPVSIKKIEFEDWAEELAEYPFWAIQRACRWWKSSENPDRRRRPIEGDIAARIKVEMNAVRAMKIVLASPAPQPAAMGEAAAERHAPSPEQAEDRRRIAEEILRGFRSGSAETA